MRIHAVNLRKWAEGVDPILAVYAIQAATAAPMCLELLKMADGEGLPARFPDAPPVAEWLSIYRDHKRIRKVLSRYITPMVVDNPDQQQIVDIWLADNGRALRRTQEQRDKILSQVTPEVRASVEKRIRETHDALVRKFWEDLEHELAEEAIEGPIWDQVGEAVQTPEFQFFFRVWFPCWVLYGECAKALFARCRRGDLDALEKLLPLDRRILAEPRIADLMKHSNDPKKAALEKCIVEAFSKSIKRPTVRQLKISFASLISKMFQIAKNPITAPKIINLFDSFAKDSGKGLIDSDLQESPGAVAKAIQRGRKFWLVFPNPDKKGL